MATFKAFDEYPWTKDPRFQALLAHELQQTNTDNESPAQIALRVRIQRFSNLLGIAIDNDGYLEYRKGNELAPVDIVSEIIPRQDSIRENSALMNKYQKLTNSPPVEGDQKSAQAVIPNNIGASDIPFWQKTAPKAKLYVERGAATSEAQGAEGKEPYPQKFAQIIEFLQSGKEIEGIQKIPDTIIEDPSILAAPSQTAPSKPWEKQ